jgi:tetratricopeptide (TPR) repeat protein
MRLVLAVLSVVLLAVPAMAQDAPRPWEAAARISDAALADVQSDGILALREHVAGLEKVLSEAPAAYATADAGEGNTRYILTDGPSDALVSLAIVAVAEEQSATSAGSPRSVVAIDNPYPMIAFMLGSYHVETGAMAEALRVLDAGLAHPTNDLLALSQTRPLLLLERGVALGQLRRYADAASSYEQVLAISDLPDQIHARALRGRGIALIDLNRLNEAEADLRRSLQFDPDSRVALGEIEYIARLRAGAPPTTLGVTTLQPQ